MCFNICRFWLYFLSIHCNTIHFYSFIAFNVKSFGCIVSFVNSNWRRRWCTSIHFEFRRSNRLSSYYRTCISLDNSYICSLIATSRFDLIWRRDMIVCMCIITFMHILKIVCRVWSIIVAYFILTSFRFIFLWLWFYFWFFHTHLWLNMNLKRCDILAFLQNPRFFNFI